MASHPQPLASPVAAAKPLPVLSPASRVLEVSTPPLLRSVGDHLSLTDDAIWKRLHDAGLDEESIKKRDKASLIAYIARLEKEIHEYQHHMGLLLLEREEWTTKYEEAKMSADSAEAMRKRDQAAHLSALSEVRKQEESLQRALGVEKECVANTGIVRWVQVAGRECDCANGVGPIEKALHEMRAEAAETKVASESKLAEACIMIEDAEKKFLDAKAKLHAAELLEAEAKRYHSTAERKLQEVEAREDELRRRSSHFKSECDAKEKEISLERKSLSERQRSLQQGQERLLEGQALLNQREEYILGKSQNLSRLEKELEAKKAEIEKEFLALKEEESKLDAKMVSFSSREEAVIRREALLDKREQEFLVLQEKIGSKAHDEIQKLTAEQQATLEKRKLEVEADLEKKRKLLEDELEIRRQACELREGDLSDKENEIERKAHDFEQRLNSLAEKESYAAQLLSSLNGKEESLNSAKEAAETDMMLMQKEREEIANMKQDLQKYKDSLEEERKQILLAQEKLEISKVERDELLCLQTKLKEEIDSLRAQKQELMVGLDALKTEKEKFEYEWQSLDEKREELQKEAQRVAEERNAVSMLLKNEKNCLNAEKDALRDKFNHDLESLAYEREFFKSKVECEHSDWFAKIQQERADFIQDIELRRQELENSITGRREEIERYLREKEAVFEQKKEKELKYISIQKELIAKDLEHVASEMRRLEIERAGIVLDQKQRVKEWSEIKEFIDELQVQRERLQKQRELLHADSEGIQIQIESLAKLEALKTALENKAFSETPALDLDSKEEKLGSGKLINAQTITQVTELNSNKIKHKADVDCGVGLVYMQESTRGLPHTSTPLSWVRKCADLILKPSADKRIDVNDEKMSTGSEQRKSGNIYSQSGLKSVSTLLENSQKDTGRFDQRKVSGKDKRMGRIIGRSQTGVSVLDEPKVIFEVPAVGENVKSLRTSNTELHTIQDLSGVKVISSDGGANSSVGRRKRQQQHSSSEVSDELISKHKKMRHCKDSSKIVIEENPSNWYNSVVSTEMPSAENQKNSISFNHACVDGEETDDYVADTIEIREIPAEGEEGGCHEHVKSISSKILVESGALLTLLPQELEKAKSEVLSITDPPFISIPSLNRIFIQSYFSMYLFDHSHWQTA
ncbi:hypothetical protein ACLOJK_036088 [Asimina triloba]